MLVERSDLDAATKGEKKEANFTFLCVWITPIKSKDANGN